MTTSRRDFIRKGSLWVAGAAAVALLPEEPIKRIWALGMWGPKTIRVRSQREWDRAKLAATNGDTIIVVAGTKVVVGALPWLGLPDRPPVYITSELYANDEFGDLPNLGHGVQRVFSGFRFRQPSPVSNVTTIETYTIQPLSHRLS